VATDARRSRLTATDWAQAALAAVAEGGLAAVAVEPLAARLGATKGSFYWHFANRDALVVAALELWELHLTDEVIAVVTREPDPVSTLRSLMTRVIGSAGRSALEAQLLAAADHPLVGDVVRRVVARRVVFVTGVFEQAGFAPADAAVRATLLYTAYAGHDQLLARLPGVLPLAAAGGTDGYLDAVLGLMLGAGGSASPRRPTG
jgi:AcrR family transcriptional regulator